MPFVVRVYKNLLAKFPFTVQTVQTGCLFGLGDICSQTIVEKRSISNINYARVVQFTSVGFFVAGPALVMWYRALGKYVGTSGSKSVTLKKVALDQLLFAPSFVAVLLTSIGLAQGESFDQVVTGVKRDYADIIVNNYKLWPLVQLGNFYLVPLNYQTLVVQVVALFWNTYISWKTHKFAKPMNNIEENKLL